MYEGERLMLEDLENEESRFGCRPHLERFQGQDGNINDPQMDQEPQNTLI